MAAWLAVVAWCTRLVVVQGGKELSLPWTAETCVGEGGGEALVGLDNGNEMAKGLEVMVFDLCAGPHHEGTRDDDLVLGLVLLPRIVAILGEAAVLVDKFVSKTGVELLAQTFQSRVVLS